MRTQRMPCRHIVFRSNNHVLCTQPGGVWNRNRSNDDDGTQDDDPSISLPHSDYIALYNTWHGNLGASFIGCLQSSEYMHNRTALIILFRMVGFFPTKSTLGEKLLNALAPLQEDSNPMQDIKAMAQGYSSKIIQARDTGTWKEEDSKATKARADKVKKQTEDRLKKAEKRMEEMEKEMGDSRPDKKPADRRGPPPRFTPAASAVGKGFTPAPSAPKAGDVAPQPNGDRGRGPRDQKSLERPPRRDETRNSDQERWDRNGPDGNRGGAKRGRSPDPSSRPQSDKSRPGDRDRDRDRIDTKRPRRSDQSPPRRGARRSTRR